MADDYTMITLTMIILMIFFFVAEVSSITWDQKNGKKKPTVKFAAALSFITLLVTIVRLVIAIQLNKMNASNIILVLAWLFISVLQVVRIKNIGR